MPEQDHHTDDTAAQGRRFRLPKLFADATDAEETDKTDPTTSRQRLLQSAEALGATISLPAEAAPPAETPSPATAVPASNPVPASPESEVGEPRATVLTIPTHVVSREPTGAKPKAKPDAKQPAPAEPSSDLGTMAEDIAALRSEVEDISRSLLELNERGMTQDKVFNALHSELQDYKNDFLYEHLKPIVRPLLFLYDSLDQFDNELAEYERTPDRERRGGITPTVVRENIVFFREQLVESLRICEVIPMQRPEGEYDIRLHKAVEVVPVEPEQNNVIQRVVRSGWYLNGRVFRPAEVVIGKSRDGYNAELWNYGNKS